MKKITFERSVFILVFVLSFILSLHLFLNKIDPDSFSYYYIGRGIAHGMDIYADFAANKGPINFLFFALLNIAFGNHYLLAFVVASTLLDFLAVLLLYNLIVLWFGKLKNKSTTVLFVLFGIIFYKFSYVNIGLSGLFSESVALPLVFASLYFFYKDRRNLSALLFALSFLARPTVFFFGFVFFVQDVFLDQDIRKFLTFTWKAFLWMVSVLLLTGIFGNLAYFYKNVILFNLGYTQAVAEDKLGYFLSTIFYQPAMLLSFIFTAIFLVIFLFSNLLDRRKKIIFFAVAVSSYITTFVGGFYYYHHSPQFTPLIFSVVYMLLAKDNYKIIGKFFIFATILLSFVTGYLYYFAYYTPRSKADAYISQYLAGSSKKYVKVITYQPNIYIDNNVYAPDRYFHSFFLLDSKNKNAEISKVEHASLDPQILKDTVFVSVYLNTSDRMISEEYMSNFEDLFKLRTERLYYDGGTALVEIFSSDASRLSGGGI